MTFSRLTSMFLRRAPKVELTFPAPLWKELVTGLRARGRDVRESGAFLLGTIGETRSVSDIVFYDELDPHVSDTGIIVFNGACLADLWRLCRERGCSVVADVHTHPGSSRQSRSDERHPMIAERGHLSMIIPDFAAEPVRLKEVGLYRYLGNFQWETLPLAAGRPAFEIVEDR